jgi:hypothetical protein
VAQVDEPAEREADRRPHQRRQRHGAAITGEAFAKREKEGDLPDHEGAIGPAVGREEAHTPHRIAQAS